MGGKTLHGERGDRCRREIGTVRCRKRQKERRRETHVGRFRERERCGERNQENVRYFDSGGR